MKKYICFQNAGEIEVACFQLLGASTKRNDDTKIGFFGSGLKYAIAFLVRNGIEFHCYTGTRRIDISSQLTTIRDAQFQQIVIDGVPTSITTDWGINWSYWQIFRELTSNALDEGGRVFYHSNPEPMAGMTSIYVNAEPFTEYLDNMSEYIRPELTPEGTQILLKPRASSLLVFKKGVRVVPEKSPVDRQSIFDYQLQVPLSEERLAADHNIESEIFNTLMDCEDSKIVKRLVAAVLDKEDYTTEFKVLKSKLPVYTWKRFTDTWRNEFLKRKNQLCPDRLREVVSQQLGQKEIAKRKLIFIPDDIYRAIESNFTGEEFLFKGFDQSKDYTVIEGTEHQIATLAGVVDALKSYVGNFAYPVEIASFVDEGVHGLAVSSEKRILISVNCFTRGKNYILSTLIEEYIHLAEDASDFTRAFQTAVCDLAATAILRGV
jgi:hypothetical protein